MTWYYWALVIWLVIEAAMQVITIGKPREPRTPWEALVSIVCFGLIIWGIVAAATS